MIDQSKIDIAFMQSGGSCVLASYGIAFNYFTGGDVGDCFVAYCKHFKINASSKAVAEAEYAKHFDREWKKRNCRGYEVVLELHQTAMEKVFVDARQSFEATFFLDSAKEISNIETGLKRDCALFNATYEVVRGQCHSIIVGYNGSHFVTRDTNKKILGQISGLSSLGSLRDGVLYCKRP